MTYTADTPLCGTPQTTGDPELAIVRYLMVKRSVEEEAYEIAGAYSVFCELHGIDPILACAQACHETAHFSSWWWEAHSNPAGIAVTGATRTQAQGHPGEVDWQWNPVRQLWCKGRHFGSAVEGIANHVGLLAVYCRDAQKGEAPTSLAWWARANKNPSTHPCYNSAVTPAHLGAAKNPTKKGWAYPGTHYGEGIAKIAAAIVLP